MFPSLVFTNWRKSTYSEPAEDCFEVAFNLDHTAVGIRDSSTSCISRSTGCQPM